MLVPVWRLAVYLFSERNARPSHGPRRTHVSETHASNDAHAATAADFSEKDLLDLAPTIATMNAINRLGISFRLKPRAKADA